MLDNLSKLVIHTQDYLNKDISLATYKHRLTDVIGSFSDDEATALADVISAFAILLRGKSH
jgi:hypothetical protein